MDVQVVTLIKDLVLTIAGAVAALALYLHKTDSERIARSAADKAVEEHEKSSSEHLEMLLDARFAENREILMREIETKYTRTREQERDNQNFQRQLDNHHLRLESHSGKLNKLESDVHGMTKSRRPPGG